MSRIDPSGYQTVCTQRTDSGGKLQDNGSVIWSYHDVSVNCTEEGAPEQHGSSNEINKHQQFNDNAYIPYTSTFGVPLDLSKDVVGWDRKFVLDSTLPVVGPAMVCAIYGCSKGGWSLGILGVVPWAKAGREALNIPIKLGNSKKALQIEAQTTQSKAISELIGSGFSKTATKTPDVHVLTDGTKTYVMYPKSTGGGIPGPTTGVPSAEVRVNGELISKIRFLEGL